MNFSYSFIDEKVQSHYYFEQVSSLNEIDDEEFIALTKKRSFYVSKPWLTAIERMRGKDTAYIVVRNNQNKLLGVLPFYWGKPSVRGYYEPFKRFLEPTKGNFIEKDWSPTLIIGSRSAYACEFLLSEHLSTQEQTLILQQMITCVQNRMASYGAASLSALYINKEGCNQLKQIVSNPEDFFITGANAVITIEWSTFEDYLLSLKSKERTKARKERGVFLSKGYDIRLAKLEDSLETFAQLFINHEHKYGYQTSLENQIKELEVFIDTADEYSHILTLNLKDVVAGCLLLFLWEDTIYARTVGFDFDIVGQSFEYFNLGYYALIEFAIDRNFKYIDYGMGTYRAKLKRGAHLEPVYGYIYSPSTSSPFIDSEFKQWNEFRTEAVIQNNIDVLERINFP